MKLAHLADLHLGFRQYEADNPAGANQREADVTLAFGRTIDAVIARAPDVVVVAGDIFHASRPSNNAVVAALAGFTRLRAALPDAAIVLCAGNHDQPRAAGQTCILEMLRPFDIRVAIRAPERFEFPKLGLAVLAVPELAAGAGVPALDPLAVAQYNVLVLHGEVEGMWDGAPTPPPYEIVIGRDAVRAHLWSYVALGHYHVQKFLAANMAYAGGLEYTSSDPWGEVREERGAGKAWLLRDLDTGETERVPIAHERRYIDLPEVVAIGLTAAEVDAAVAERVAAAEPIDGQVVRIIVRALDRGTNAAMDHKALRKLRHRALAFRFIAKPPTVVKQDRATALREAVRRVGLPEQVAAYLTGRTYEPDIDKAAVVALGAKYLAEADAIARDGAKYLAEADAIARDGAKYLAEADAIARDGAKLPDPYAESAP